MATQKKKRNILFTPPFRVSYPHVFVPQEDEKGNLSYSVSAVWDTNNFSEKNQELWDAILAEMDRVCLEKFDKTYEQCKKSRLFKAGIRSGEDEKPATDEVYHFPGSQFASLKSRDSKPGIVDRDREPITSADKFYAGCHARATVTVYAFDNKSQGVSLGLNNLQFIDHGKPITQRKTASQDFENAEEPDYEADYDTDIDDIL